VTNNLVLTWSTVAGKTNRVLFSPVLTAPLAQWTDLSGPIVGPGSGPVTVGWTHTGVLNSGGAGYYRIKREP
jgi:hypothetical protein